MCSSCVPSVAAMLAASRAEKPLPGSASAETIERLMASSWRFTPAFTAPSVTTRRRSTGTFTPRISFSISPLPSSASSTPAAAPAIMPAGPAPTSATPPPPQMLAPTAPSTTPSTPESTSMPIALASESLTPLTPALTRVPLRDIRSGGTPQRMHRSVISPSSSRIRPSVHTRRSSRMRTATASLANALSIFCASSASSSRIVSTPPRRHSATVSTALSRAASNSACASGAYSSCTCAFTAACSFSPRAMEATSCRKVFRRSSTRPA